ncbi:unnamed protein product [Candidula unifasciata]|uniref:Hexosyltransferase n=1 Tax=Candidula unifasciata TaxID=100452 RepID=A0A8S3ZKX9_9EUPU|nr:unnamed protein product [Candidula unifasciata]
MLQVMRRKEIEHIREKSMLQKKITSLEAQLTKVQEQVANLTITLRTAVHNSSRLQPEASQNIPVYVGQRQHVQYLSNQDSATSSQLADRIDSTSKKFQLPSQDIRLAYPNDGLNPVPRYRSQNDKNPIFYQEDRRYPHYPNYNTNTNRYKEENVLDNTGNDYIHDNQFDSALQKRQDQIDPNPLAHEKYKDEIKSNNTDSKLSEREMRDTSNDEMAIKENIFRSVPDGSIRLDRRAPESAEVLGSKQKLYPSVVGTENDPKDINKITGNESEQTNLEKYFQERLKMAEILKGQSYKTEYELIPFNRFIFNRIFLVDPGLGKRVVEKPIGSKKKDLNEILFNAVETLNTNRQQNSQYTYNDFIEGIYRSDPATGSQYELFFSNKDDKGLRHLRSYIKLTLFRPFAPPMAVQRTVINTASEWINIILPLSNRVDTFKLFMDQFVSVCIKRDRRIYLTVVYFGIEGLKEVKAIMSLVAKTHKFKHMKLVTLNETFTRGRGLQLGALNWKGGGDVLLFFCDVDIVFTSDFLERCRLNSDKGLRVYYPIVFSLYNPNIVYSLQDVPLPSMQDQLIVSKDTGFWRDFGYGMACLYRSDFLKIKGFDEQITGWGGEDVFLYQKFVRSEYFVVRATDPAIFHLWHEKVCDPMLSTEQYRSCIRSKALNEASHAQLGLLAFKDEIDVHRGISENNSLLNKEKNG